MDAALLDTDVLSEVLKRRDDRVAHHAVKYLQFHSKFALSAITRYELLRGLKEKAAPRQLAQFELFCVHSEIVPIDNRVLDRAADLWVTARRAGLPARDADLIIAATALNEQRVLVTGNVAPFSWIPSLTITNWRNA